MNLPSQEHPRPKPQTRISTGRGGAGNIGSGASSKTAKPSLDSLKTPHIKTEHYTTGRGGQGNAQYNHPSVPEMARASQDVVAPPVRREVDGVDWKIHHGRGGAANVAKAAESGDGKVEDEGGAGVNGIMRGRVGMGKERRPSQGWADKGREMLMNLRSVSGRRKGVE